MYAYDYNVISILEIVIHFRRDPIVVSYVVFDRIQIRKLQVSV